MISNTNIDSFLKQFIEHNKDQMPALIDFVKQIRQQFKEAQAKEGTLTAVISAYHYIDTLLAEGFAKSTQHISCHNCQAAHCCHQTIELSEIEAFVIAQYCKENKIIIPRTYLQKQLAHGRDLIGYKNCSACVFLKENKCSIYPVRPGACRTYYVANPQEFCDIKKHKRHRIEIITNTAANMVATVIALEGGKVDRMPRLLLKYSR